MTWLIILLSLYVVYCGLLYFFQGKLLFPARFAGPAGDTLPTAETERLLLGTDEGDTIAWFVPAPGSSDASPAPLAVFFHGNAELIDQQRPIIDLYHDLGVSVLMVEYRGYGHSGGTPSEKHIVADTLAVLEGVLERDDVDAEKLVLHGRSIGGGLATQVALRTDPRALIVESTFKSIAGMSWRYGVPPFLVTNPLRSDRAFEQLDIPILIMHGQDDQIVPVAQAKALDAIAKQPTLVVFDADHNTLPTPGQAALYAESVREHLTDAGVLPE